MKAGKLPHLPELVKAFFEGALEKAADFMEEFNDGGEISLLTAAQRERSFRPATNDISEGGLGSYRIFAHRAPQSSVLFNAQTMNQQNDTEAWQLQHLTPDDDAVLRHQARLIEKARPDQAHRRLLDDTRTAKFTAQKAKMALKEAIHIAKEAKIDAIALICDEGWLLLKGTTIVKLNDQMADGRFQAHLSIRTAPQEGEEGSEDGGTARCDDTMEGGESRPQRSNPDRSTGQLTRFRLFRVLPRR
jgi:hypothetical protein